MITDAAGAVSEQIRYHPYGEVRGRYDANDNPIGEPGEDDIRYEFTGYEAERASGLLYANARFYDPAVGTFLTHDPAAQFWSPYTYTGWDPVNIVDPSGALGVVAGIVLAFSIGFLVGFGQALENGASFGDALVAGVISGGIAAVSAAVLGPVSNWVNAAAAKGAYLVAIGFYGLSGGAAVYGTVTSFQNGQNVAGVAGAVGIVLLAIGAYAAYGKYKAYVEASPSDVAKFGGDGSECVEGCQAIRPIPRRPVRKLKNVSSAARSTRRMARMVLKQQVRAAKVEGAQDRAFLIERARLFVGARKPGAHFAARLEGVSIQRGGVSFGLKFNSIEFPVLNTGPTLNLHDNGGFSQLLILRAPGGNLTPQVGLYNQIAPTDIGLHQPIRLGFPGA